MPSSPPSSPPPSPPSDQGKPAAVQNGGGAPPPRNPSELIWRIWVSIKWEYVLVGVLLGFIAVSVLIDSPVIRRLIDPAFARGLITFIISVATVGLGFVLVCESFAPGPDDGSDEKFRRAREIFTLLLGILGTVVGFYFGSAERGTAGGLAVADITATDRELIAHVSGGSPPYRYSVSSDDRDFTPIKDKISQDGWIIETLNRPCKPGSKLTIAITDGKNQTASGNFTVPTP
jgi:hypothetical protein